MTIRPPTGGPSIGPMVAGTSSHAMAETRSALATVRNSTSLPTGTIIAPPMPCRMRAQTRKGRLLACPHKIDPRVKSAIAARKTSRAPNRSASLPLTGMKTARLSRYAVKAMFICSGSTAKVRAILGKAVARTDELSCSMKSAQETMSAVARAVPRPRATRRSVHVVFRIHVNPIGTGSMVRAAQTCVSYACLRCGFAD